MQRVMGKAVAGEYGGVFFPRMFGAEGNFSLLSGCLLLVEFRAKRRPSERYGVPLDRGKRTAPPNKLEPCHGRFVVDVEDDHRAFRDCMRCCGVFFARTTAGRRGWCVSRICRRFYGHFVSRQVRWTRSCVVNEKVHRSRIIAVRNT